MNKLRGFTADVLEMTGLEKDARGYITALFGLASSCFFLFTSYYGSLPNISQRAMLLILVLPIIIMAKPTFPKYRKLSFCFDVICSIAALASFIYVIAIQKEVGWRMGKPNDIDMILGFIGIAVVIFATKKKSGWALPLIVLVFIAYGFLGRYMPMALMHKGIPIRTFISSLYLAEEGLFTTPCQVAADFIMVFIIFGAILEATGAGEFFTDIADGLFGRTRGGPAKAATASSCLMGTISGSAVANVVTTGTFTIPLMKKTGYRPEVAGAVEAVASTGGQIMPPVMGAAAFIMSDFLGVPYWTIVKAAFIPAMLYYLALYFMVDFEAGKTNLKGRPKEELPNAREVIKKGWHLLIPIAVLIYLLGVVKYSPQKSAGITILCTLAVSLFRQHTRINLKKLFMGLIKGALGGVEVAAVCACAGIVVGIVLRTGLGASLTGMLVQLAGGRLLVLMVLTMICSIIMGMGLPTSACYIIAVVLIAPAMTDMGVSALAAHMFCFYFACLSCITPPVALAAYAGAGIAGCSSFKCGWQAVRLGLCGFIVPYMFVYGPPLLMQAPVPEIIQAIISASIGCYALAASLIGYMRTRLDIISRIILFGASLFLIIPGTLTDLIGLAFVIVIFVLNTLRMKKHPEISATV